MRLTARVRYVLTGTMCAVAIASVMAMAGPPPSEGGIEAHEWGTFTSVAGADGQAVSWRPFSGPSDLPCFVHVLKDGPKTWVQGGLPAVHALVRMETPVIYFYAPGEAERSVDVRVQFNSGLLTEWYPQSTTAPKFIPKQIEGHVSTLEWRGVKVRPTATPKYPTEKAPSHYYAARATEAHPVVASGQAEKFLFYRGLASFRPQLAATATDTDVAIENTGRGIERLVLFQNRGGRIGYRMASAPLGRTTVAAPALTGSVESLGADLERILVEQGLFAPEARAMVATWRDSWFEEGTRLFYILPATEVDAVLPLDIQPAPSRVVRTFVGRLELATPEILSEIAMALRLNNVKALFRYSRFVEPFAQQVLSRAPDIDRARVDHMLRLIAASYGSEVPCG